MKKTASKTDGLLAKAYFGEDKVPDNMDPEFNRNANRKLITSRAYHLAAHHAWSQGNAWDDCKEFGRQAHAQAGAEFDQMWPRKAKSEDVG